MNLVKCENGHYYDAERYPGCPHCAAPALRDNNLTVPVLRTPANDAVTVALDPSEQAQAAESLTESTAQTGSLMQAVQAASTGAVNAPVESDEKTVGFFSSKIGTEPVVGWMVCTQGEHFGEDFKLKSGRNFIGRSAGMDVALVKDGTVSRDRHAVIVYDPKANVFIVQAGDSKELSYLGGDVVLSPREIKAYDRLTVGKTELMFIPCCAGQFTWEIQKEESEQ